VEVALVVPVSVVSASFKVDAALRDRPSLMGVNDE